MSGSGESQGEESYGSDEEEHPNVGFNLLFGNLGSNDEVEADWLDEVFSFQD